MIRVFKVTGSHCCLLVMKSCIEMEKNDQGLAQECNDETGELYGPPTSEGDISECTNEDLPEDAEDKEGESNENRGPVQYEGRKPKWWKALCKKPSKAQKKAQTEILQDLRMPRVPYGSFIQWGEVFPSDDGNDKNIWLELGFGRGENFLALAHRKKTTISLVGAEIHQGKGLAFLCESVFNLSFVDHYADNYDTFLRFPGGIGYLCQRILHGRRDRKFSVDYTLYTPERDPYSNSVESKELLATKNSEEVTNDKDNNESRYSTLEEDPYSNVRIYPGDGVKLLPYIPSNSLSVILVTFPDPFPQKGHEKWRLIQQQTLLDFHRILQPSTGRLFLATDDLNYHNWTHELINQLNNNETTISTIEEEDSKQQRRDHKIIFRLIEPCPDRLDWLPAISRYEQKGWDEGRETRLSCWEAVPSM